MELKRYFVTVDLSYNYEVLSESAEAAEAWAREEILKEEPDIEVEEVED